jgi:hypothetical protein
MRLAVSFIALLVADIAFAGVSVAPRQSEFEKALKVLLTTIAPNRPIPEVNHIVKEYEDASANKAIAIEPVYGKTWRVSRYEQAEEAAERVLEACQLRYGKPCALIGVNEEIVSAAPPAPKDMPRLHYRGKFNLDQIPAIKSAQKTRPDLQGYEQMSEPKVIVMHPWGRLFVSRGSSTLKEAKEKTLAMCNEDPDRNGKDGDCFLYAINNDVVIADRFSPPKGSPKRNKLSGF